MIHRMAVAHEGATDCIGYDGVVFNDKNPHVLSILRPSAWQTRHLAMDAVLGGPGDREESLQDFSVQVPPFQTQAAAVATRHVCGEVNGSPACRQTVYHDNPDGTECRYRELRSNKRTAEAYVREPTRRDRAELADQLDLEIDRFPHTPAMIDVEAGHN
jgi:hypothetical protein